MRNKANCDNCGEAYAFLGCSDCGRGMCSDCYWLYIERLTDFAYDLDTGCRCAAFCESPWTAAAAAERVAAAESKAASDPVYRPSMLDRLTSAAERAHLEMVRGIE